MINNKIVVNRFTSDKETTLSLVSLNAEHQCFGLEDQFQAVKVKGETRVPAGVYPITVRQEGGFHGRYNRKFPGFHDGMLWIRDVPGFEYILIHVGNDDDDTAGCLLLGSGVSTANGLTITRSVKAYKAFYKKVIEMAKSGTLTIEFVDNDGAAS